MVKGLEKFEKSRGSEISLGWLGVQELYKKKGLME